MMRMFGSLVCISTLRVFSEVAESRAGTASGSAGLLPFGAASAVIDRLSALVTVAGLVRSGTPPVRFRR